jgi:hypothetical protein
MKAKIDRPTMPQSVVQQIVQLPELAMPEIKKIWLRLFHDITPTHNRQFLERRIAYKLQEIEFYKTDRNLLDRNKRRIAALIKNGKASMREAAYRPVAGTMLSRLYQGKQYHVIASQDGTYEFDGRPFESLSKIAYEITGTRWSGPLFFGLRARPDTKASPKKGARA